MLCEKCHSNEAIMHLTHFFNGRGGTMHLCADCARKLGVDALHPPAGISAMEHLIERLLHVGDPAPSRAPHALSAFRSDPGAPDACPSCGLSREGMADADCAGCPDCLQWLLRDDDPLDDPYLGKVPASLSPADRDRLESIRLRARLRRAVRAERYEEAAALKAALRALPAHGTVG